MGFGIDGTEVGQEVAQYPTVTKGVKNKPQAKVGAMVGEIVGKFVGPKLYAQHTALVGLVKAGQLF